MWVFGWPFDEERVAKLAREWKITPPDATDEQAQQDLITRIYCLRHRYPAEYVFAERDNDYLPIIALCSDKKAHRKEDAKVPRDAIPPYKTCVRIRRLLGIRAGVAPQWYWTDDMDDDPRDGSIRTCNIMY